MKSLTKWVKKIHNYVGLLNFTILIVFGIVGIAVSVSPPGPRPRPEPVVREVAFTAPGNLDDEQLANRVQETLDIPLTGPPRDFQIRRGKDGQLRVRLGTPATMYTVIVREDQDLLRVETVPFDKRGYLFHLHEMTPGAGQPDWRLSAWAWYVEFSIWSLTFMALTGVYLWLVSRPKWRWAQVAFASGSALSLLVYVLGR